MARYNLLEMNIPKLFEEKSIEEMIEIDKLLDAEIERKRVELRSMVGDRYKDILTATEAIKSMECISITIVNDIDKVTERCQILVENTKRELPKKPKSIDKAKIQERTILMQIRLAIELNENIWRAIDAEDYCKAAQLYLLTQHVHTGLRLLSKDIFENYSIIRKLKETVDNLRSNILFGVNKKLQTVELSAESTCSNLNALMLLENHTNHELLNKFIDLRKKALKTVIETPHPSVRAQISAMVKCLYTTVHLLHNCFINYKETKRGLIWHQIGEIVSPDSAPTLSKLALPESNLISYIPEIIKQFRPKCGNTSESLSRSESIDLVQKWVEDTDEKVRLGLNNALELVASVKGLHIIREEALKIEMPENWDNICANSELPKNFNIWYYFFQNHLTSRAEILITKKVANYISNLQEELERKLNNMALAESDLRCYIWQEDSNDLSQMNDQRMTLSMKTRGFSSNVAELCKVLDDKCLELLEDVSLYMYGKELTKGDDLCVSFAMKDNKKFIDREKLEQHLKSECSTNINNLITYLEKLIKKDDTNYVTKSIMCARFLNGLTTLCSNLTKCCCCNFTVDEWEKVCIKLNQSSLVFWENWIEKCNQNISRQSSQVLSNVNTFRMLSLLCRWDTIEIQEQTDEKTFKSQIKVPMKASVALQEVMDSMCEMLNAVLPHTLPKQVHSKFIETNTNTILHQYENMLQNKLNQTQALQFLFDVKFLTTLCIPRENLELVQKSQSICDKFRSFVDPFDLDVFYQYLQRNVKQSVLQSQVIFGCLLPSSAQLSSLGVLEKNKDHEKDPSILAMSTPATNNWFLLLPVTAPVQKTNHPVHNQPNENKVSKGKQSASKKGDSGVRSGAAALFGAMTTDWFS